MRDIIEKLLKNPGEFDFFQAVSLLEEYLAREHLPHHSSINENLRFKHHASLMFPVGEIAKISTAGSRREINTNIMGLIGPSGVLHHHHTALIIERLQHKDFTLRNFLDVFQHRLVSLYYLSWKKNHFHIAKTSKKTDILLSLIGQGIPSLQNRENISDEIMLYYAPYFCRRRRSVLGLESVLTDCFHSPVTAKVFQKKHMQISLEQRSQLNTIKMIFNQLGVNAICGHTQIQYQYHFYLMIGPLSIENFISFLPDQKIFSLLIALTRRYVGLDYTFDIKLILKAESVPYCQLGRQSLVKLGWSSWLKVREFDTDASNTVLYMT